MKILSIIFKLAQMVVVFIVILLLLCWFTLLQFAIIIPLSLLYPPCRRANSSSPTNIAAENLSSSIVGQFELHFLHTLQILLRCKQCTKKCSCSLLEEKNSHQYAINSTAALYIYCGSCWPMYFCHFCSISSSFFSRVTRKQKEAETKIKMIYNF